MALRESPHNVIDQDTCRTLLGGDVGPCVRACVRACVRGVAVVVLVVAVKVVGGRGDGGLVIIIL